MPEEPLYAVSTETTGPITPSDLKKESFSTICIGRGMWPHTGFSNKEKVRGRESDPHKNP